MDKDRIWAVIDDGLSRQRQQIEDRHLKRISEFSARQFAPYRIGIITALPKEAAAVRAVFEAGSLLASSARTAVEFREIACPILGSADNSRHQIVLCQSLRMGNNSAAVAAAALLADFPTIEDVLLVGIAGGVPNMKAARARIHGVDDHVRKGDIVVSDQVVQYDFVKLEEDTSENRAKPKEPSARLLRAVEQLEQEAILGQRPWEKIIAEVGARMDWKHPRTDILFDFESGMPQRLEHPNTDRRVGFPTVFRGTIGSANILLKSHSVRDELRDKHKVRAVEMESSGIADAAWSFDAGYIAVRGICDYCDGSKDDKWQNRAALVAAAYAKTLIERVPV